MSIELTKLSFHYVLNVTLYTVFSDRAVVLCHRPHTVTSTSIAVHGNHKIMVDEKCYLGVYPTTNNIDRPYKLYISTPLENMTHLELARTLDSNMCHIRALTLP